MSGLIRSTSKLLTKISPFKNVSNSNVLKVALDPIGTGASRISKENRPLTLQTVGNIGQFFTKSPAPVVPTTPMPDEQQVALDSRRLASASALQRKGRQSTILSQGTAGSDTLG